MLLPSSRGGFTVVSIVQKRLKGAAAAGAAAVVAAGMVSALPERSDALAVRAVAAQVELQAAVTQIAGLVSSVPHPSPAAASSPTGPTASATASDPYEDLRSFLTTALLPVGLVIAPFWYLGALITYPLYTQIKQAITGVYQPGIFGFLDWFIAPFSLASLVFPRPSVTASTSATQTSAPARAVATAPTVVVSLNGPAAVGVPASEPEIVTQREAVTRSSNRSTAVRPLPAAAQAAVEVQQVDQPVSVPSSVVPTAGRDGREPTRSAAAHGGSRGAARTAGGTG